MDKEKLLGQMTLEEKASLCSGADFWHLKGIERLGIPSIMVTDGPHGLRKQEGESDHVGLNDSVPATCFPTASCTAASWDRSLMEKIGTALGEECQAAGVAVILGPAINIKRSPLCGRNFEYVSEDPYLSGELAAALIQGVQAQGVGTSLKHFAANDQETFRMTNDSVVDERTLREIYLSGFEAAVKKAQPWTVMCSYNKINGAFASENPWLLTEVLKGQWGHEGIVMTDWGANNDRVAGLKAGQELEMPASGGYTDRQIVEAVTEGCLDEAVLDRTVLRILDLIDKAVTGKKPGARFDASAHHALARQAAGQSAVLLKNEGSLLPLKTGEPIALIGGFAKSPRYQGAGSSLIHPLKLDSAYDEIQARGLPMTYAQGYPMDSDQPDESLIEEACRAAAAAQVAVIFAGLPASYESEGFDRQHMDMPEAHNELIRRVCQAQPRTVVVLSGGAPVTMPWLEQTPALLNLYLGGEAGGSAAIDLLYGDVNPSGKLAETYPLSLEDTPCYGNFAVHSLTTEYREGLYVGYRYYDAAKKPVRFPFGFGLSYTSFAYSDLALDHTALKEGEGLSLKVTITNTGSRAGAESFQVYVRPPQGPAYRPEKELKGFAKVFLEPGESRTVAIQLEPRAFAYYNPLIHDWYVASGTYRVLVGASSQDIRLEAPVEVISLRPDAPQPDLRQLAPAYYHPEQSFRAVPDGEFEALLGRPLPQAERLPGDPFDRNSTVSDMRTTPAGRAIFDQMMAATSSRMGIDPDPNDPNYLMAEHMMQEMPLRNLGMFGGMDPAQVDALIDRLNQG